MAKFKKVQNCPLKKRVLPLLKKFSTSIKKMKVSMDVVSDKKQNKSLADLKVGESCKILRIIPQARGEKKFSDVGLVPGTELIMEAKAPFGGLIRVKVMETSMALHKDDAKNILIESNK